MTWFRFTGNISSGIGEHSKLVIPGSNDIFNPPVGWPDVFCSGSLNVVIQKTGYPIELINLFNGNPDTSILDAGIIKPDFSLSFDQIKNNTIRPTQNSPQKGTGQFWAIKLTSVLTYKSIDCWVFRRIGSSIKKQLEIISDVFLRSNLSLVDGSEVYIDFANSINLKGLQ